jgi:hypothetical protein
MSIKITASANGSVTPPTEDGKSVVNGDFLIGFNRIVPSLTTGDGVDEETSWTFFFNEDPNFSLFSSSQPLTSALLTLTLTPKDKDGGITTDAVWIETLGIIGGGASFDPIQKLPLDVTTTITIELLDNFPGYTSPAILGILFSSVGGRISMRYQDDAIVSFAKLELTQESLNP